MSIVKRMLKEAQSTKPVVIQLTAMVDMFTILVVFLLKSMGDTSIKLPPEEIRLPTAYYAEEPKESLLIQVSPKYIVVNDKQVVAMKEGQIAAADLSKDDLFLISGLEKELLAQAEISKNVEKQTKNLIQFKGTVFIQVDKDLDYSTLKRVLYTASVAGYGDLRLATINGAE